MLPEKENFNQKDIDDAKAVAEQFHLKTQICDMSDALNAFTAPFLCLTNPTDFARETSKQEQG